MNKFFKILIFLFLISFSLFGQTEKNLIHNFLSSSSERNPSDSNFYFPLPTKIDSNKCIGLDTFINKWYSKHLMAMHEPVLFKGTPNKQVFRFTWLRTFHNPVMIRIENSNNSVSLFYKTTDGAGGYEPDKILIDKEKKLSLSDWDAFIQLVDSCHFWSMLPCEKYIEGFDGSQWIMEGSTNVYYQVVDKWSPESGAYYDCCTYLIRLTDLKIKNKEIY